MCAFLLRRFFCAPLFFFGSFVRLQFHLSSFLVRMCAFELFLRICAPKSSFYANVLFEVRMVLMCAFCFRLVRVCAFAVRMGSDVRQIAHLLKGELKAHKRTVYISYVAQTNLVSRGTQTTHTCASDALARHIRYNTLHIRYTYVILERFAPHKRSFCTYTSNATTHTDAHGASNLMSAWFRNLTAWRVRPRFLYVAECTSHSSRGWPPTWQVIASHVRQALRSVSTDTSPHDAVSNEGERSQLCPSHREQQNRASNHSCEGAKHSTIRGPCYVCERHVHHLFSGTLQCLYGAIDELPSPCLRCWCQRCGWRWGRGGSNHAQCRYQIHDRHPMGPHVGPTPQLALSDHSLPRQHSRVSEERKEDLHLPRCSSQGSQQDCKDISREQEEEANSGFRG